MEVFTDEYIRTKYSCKTKVSIITSILNVYCSSTYLNRNVWMLEKISETLQCIENSSRKSADCIVLICKLATYIRKLPNREFKTPHDNLQHILYSTMSFDPNIGFMRDLVTEEALCFFNILYSNMRDGQDVLQSLSIVSYILNQPVSRSKDLDGYDCLFVFLLQVLEPLNAEPNLRKYVTCCKDIFYYRLKKKDKQYRQNLIYFTVYVMVSKKVTNKALSSSGHEYLFIAPKIDQRAEEELNRLRLNCQAQIRTKNISVHDVNASKPQMKIILSNN